MNEKIKELAEQAGFKTETWRDLKGTPTTTIYKEALGGNNLEKFAELIVRECIAQCNDGDSQYFIATHFGVE